MKKLAKYIRTGDKIVDSVNGNHIVSKYRYHFGQGVETFDQYGESITIYPFNQEIEVYR